MLDLPRKALSIRQPWAYSVVFLEKDIENRSWPTRFRGEVCIHAAQGMTRAEYEDGLSTVHMVSLSRPFAEGTLFPAFDELHRGGIIGVAEIVDCVATSLSPWFFGRYGFVLRNARPVPFIKVRGALGFFDWRERMAA